MTECTEIILHEESVRRRARDARRIEMRAKPQAAPMRLPKPSSLATPRLEYCGRCRLLVVGGQGCSMCSRVDEPQTDGVEFARAYLNAAPTAEADGSRRGMHPFTAVALVLLALIVGGAVLQQSMHAHVMQVGQ